MNLWMIYDAIFLMVGLYGISLCVKVNQSKDLEDIRMLMPRDVKAEDCKDAPAFIARMLPWMLLFSLSVILTGLIRLVEDIGFAIPHVVVLVLYVLCCLSAVAFMVFQRKAVGDFWDKEDDE